MGKGEKNDRGRELEGPAPLSQIPGSVPAYLLTYLTYLLIVLSDSCNRLCDADQHGHLRAAQEPPDSPSAALSGNSQPNHGDRRSSISPR